MNFLEVIETKRGHKILVDKEDFKELVKYKWHTTKYGYPVRNIKLSNGKVTALYMHRFLMDDRFEEVDHINGNPLDNRKSNLRGCTHAENMRNVKMRSDNKTGYRGVSFHKSTGKFSVSIKRNLYIGEFTNPQHAAMAYDIWAKDLFGEFKKLNF